MHCTGGNGPVDPQLAVGGTWHVKRLSYGTPESTYLAGLAKYVYDRPLFEASFFRPRNKLLSEQRFARHLPEERFPAAARERTGFCLDPCPETTFS